MLTCSSLLLVVLYSYLVTLVISKVLVSFSYVPYPGVLQCLSICCLLGKWVQYIMAFNNGLFLQYVVSQCLS